MDIDKAVQSAQMGNRDALESVVVFIQDDVYKLSIRMLCNPDDAQDATQEIILSVITKLSTFQFKSAFKTWVYRVAMNYLLTTKKNQAKDPSVTFEQFQQDLEADLEEPTDLEKQPEYPLLLNEVRILCTMAMLLCLDRRHRATYILGEIFELDGNEASEILELSSANYRQQLSRARAKVLAFTSKACGLVSQCASCTCRTKLKGAMRRGRVQLHSQAIAEQSAVSFEGVEKIVRDIGETGQVLRAKMLQNLATPVRSPRDYRGVLAVLLE